MIFCGKYEDKIHHFGKALLLSVSSYIKPTFPYVSSHVKNCDWCTLWSSGLFKARSCMRNVEDINGA